MKNKKKKIIIITLIVIIFILLAIAIITNNFQSSEKKSVDDFKNVKEIAEYYGCIYNSMTNSEEEGFDKDINLIFSENPITNEGASNKYKYNSILGAIAAKMDKKNFRVLDETRDMIVRVYFLQDSQTYTINNDSYYFEHVASKYSMENELIENITNVTINSDQLWQIITNNWRTGNLNLGTIDSTVNKYDIYFDEGYKIRKINGQVYNIVFTNKYNGLVVNNLRTNNTLENIESVLGTPTYSNDLEANVDLIGYKTQSFYIFFTGEEISIYPNKEADKQEEFAELVTTYIEDKNVQEFLSKLTDTWPDYSDYTKYEGYVDIKYPLRGVEVELSQNNVVQVKCYNNYNGKVTNELTIQNIKENKEIPQCITIASNQNLVNLAEVYRIEMDSRYRHPWDNVETIATKQYVVYLDKEQGKCDFYSIDKQNIDTSINAVEMDNIYALNDTIFIYNIPNKGIYAYIAPNKEIKEIITGDEEFNIKSVQDSTIYYDDKSIKIN